jgi:histidinol-phosphate aminotransferase
MMSKIGKAHLLRITPYRPGKPIEEVKRELGIDDVVKLASNENPVPPSKSVLKAIAKAAREVNRYPDGSCFYLKRALAKSLKISAEEIALGNGSDELIVLALRAFAAKGDEMIIAKPTFTVYGIAAGVEGVVVREVPRRADFSYDVDAMLSAVNKKTKIVFIANPDNPTGSYMNKADLDRFIHGMPSDIVIFLDEAYYEYAKGGDYPESLKWIKHPGKNVVVARTFSKAYGLAGLRLGYVMAKPSTINMFNKVREPFNVNSIAQAAGLAALKEKKYVNDSVRHVHAEKKRFYSFFKKLGIGYVNSKANFVLVNTERDSQEVFKFLLKNGIITRDMAFWGLPGYIRMNIGLKKENERFFKVFERAVKGIAKG